MHRKVQGCYQGESEQAFIITGLDEAQALKIGRMYEQESIFFRDGWGDCYYIYCEDGHKEFVGNLVQLKEGDELPEGYFILDNGDKYTAKKS